MVSIIIPARNEEFLERTIRGVLSSARGGIEIIVILDGYIPEPQIVTNDSRVYFLHYEKSIGQRAATNEGARRTRGKYIMKLDAHCMLDEGFDVKLAADCEHNWTVIPRMYNLHIFDWICECGRKWDQATKPEQCDKCGNKEFQKKLVWEPRWKRGVVDFTRFDRDLRFQYWMNYGKRPEAKGDIVDVMSCLGACFFMEKDRYWELDGLDENHGSWGQVGTEIACKSWLSGGRMVVNKKTWFSHMFRTGRGLSFPYHITYSEQERARTYSRDLWLNNKWPKQVHQLSWLIEKFNPPDWGDNDITIIYYTANKIAKKIQDANIRHLKKFGYPVISVSQKPMDFGKNICIGDIGQNIHNIYKQVLMGAKEARTKYVALCEDDCFYTEGHFKYRPTAPFGYNLSRWLLHLNHGKFSYRGRPILSQCIADKEALIKNLEERFRLSEIPDKYCGEMGVFDKKLGMTEYGFETFKTEEPNMVVCHKNNTMGRKLLGENVCDKIPHWGEVNYWMRKFGANNYNYYTVYVGGGLREIKFGRGAKVDRQFSHIASAVAKTEDLYKYRMEFADPRKLDSMKWFIKTFRPFMESVHAGKEYTKKELEQHPYYEYLVSKLNPADRDPLTKKGKYHVFGLMKDGIKLYHDIKENGLRNPLDAWREPNGKLTINRGGRRLEILYLLNIKTAPIRLFRNKEMYAKFIPEKKIVEDGSIHHLGMKQFQKLGELATDKYWVHGYTRLYDEHIGYLRQNTLKILEIGVYRGASLLLWRDAFPHAEIYGLDKNTRIWQKFLAGQERIKVFVGRQEDKNFLNNEVVPSGPYDLIIDDCGHYPVMQETSFEVLWPALNRGGWYVLEDLYGNYWRVRGKETMIEKLKGMVDELNKKCEIKSMHFYYNICFIEKA